MIEVRSFQGGTEELAEFVAKTWRKTYEGRMPIPHWTADFFARDGGSDGVFLNCTIAAYDGARLIGVVPGWRVPVRFHGEEVLVRTGTGVCVDSEYQGHGVGKLMNQRALEHAREHGCALTLFYLYSRSPDFKGNKFWRSRGMTTREICRLGMWSRPLNPTRVSQWELWRFEAWGTRLLGPFLRGVRPAVAPDAIRELRPDDMPACASLIREAGSSMDVARLFDERTLERQLAYKDVARTWVVEHEGRVAGLVNLQPADGERDVSLAPQPGEEGLHCTDQLIVGHRSQQCEVEVFREPILRHVDLLERGAAFEGQAVTQR